MPCGPSAISYRYRRVKCDEAKPACHRCLSTGRKCDGYPTEPVNARLGAHANTQERLQRQPDVPYAPPDVHYTRQGIELFHFFRVNVAPQFAGCFDQNFWIVSIMRATNVQPAVWHACNAIAAIYKEYKLIADKGHMSKTGRRQPTTIVALQQYNHSVQHLVRIAQQQKLSLIDKEVLLVTNMLFTIICKLRADLKEAFIHLFNGLNLLDQWGLGEKMISKDSDKVSSLLSIDSLRLIFLRMYYQTDPLRFWKLDKWNQEFCENRISPVPFCNPTEAFFELELIWHAVRLRSDLVRDSNNTTEFRPLRSIQISPWASYDLWKTKYQSFQRSRYCKPEQQEQELLIIDIRKVILDITSQVDYSEGPMVWDRFESEYEEILVLAQRLCEIDGTFVGNGVETWQHRPRQFSVTPSVCEPLYQIAIWSRNYRIRRRALAILKLRRIDECMLGPEVTHWIAMCAVDIEERPWWDPKLMEAIPECSCIPYKVICAFHRIVEDHVEFLDEFAFGYHIRTMHDVVNNLPGEIIAMNTKQMK